MEVELKNKGHWTDVTLPPVMEKVIKVALVYLDSDAYQPHDTSIRSKLRKTKLKKKSIEDSDDETSELNSESDGSDEENYLDDEVSESDLEEWRQ